MRPLNRSSLSHWVYSITTRIKTKSLIMQGVLTVLIEYIPLQQGLRPLNWNLDKVLEAHWVYSITTRIKTPYTPVFAYGWGSLIEYIPLQQGLRPFIKFSIIYYFNPHWVYSITTRIKTFSFSIIYYFNYLIEYIPLQQGLRQF